MSTPCFWSSFEVRTRFSTSAARNKRDATAWQDAFLDSRTGRVHGIIDAILALLHLDLRSTADAIG
jgi:hypothetical protein